MRLSSINNPHDTILIGDLVIVHIERMSDAEVFAHSSGALGAVDSAIRSTRLTLTSKAIPAVSEMRDVIHCAVFEVPRELVEAPEWPAVDEFRPVVFFPKSLISQCRLGWFSGLELQLNREAASLQRLGVRPWNVPSLRRALTAHGYPLVG